MKIFTLFLKQIQIVLLLAGFCIPLHAKKVDAAHAEAVAQYLIELKFDASLHRSDALTLVYTATANHLSDLPLYYVFNVGHNQGFIIVSGDDIATPILGYSTEGNYDSTNIPPNFQTWMEDVGNAILKGMDDNFLGDDETQRAWSAYLNKEESFFVKTEGDRAVAKLLTTTWNQNNPYWNQCPSYSGSRCYTGCVATAMAQIMKYHNRPTTGTGTTPAYTTRTHKINIPAVNCAVNYNFGTMGAATPSTTTEQTNVARLMYHCGTSVEMDYTPTGSGAYSIDVGDAITTHFGYDKSLRYEQRIYYNNTQWVNLLKQELDAKRPIYYSGQSATGGHAFVCDGYTDQNLFHFNWGWGGTQDGNYSVTPMPSNYYPNSNVIYTNWKPNAGTATSYQIDLYTGTSITAPTSVQQLEIFTVTACFCNSGWATFPSGELAIGIYSGATLLAVIGTRTISNFMPGYYYNPLTINNCSVPTTVAPGTYTIRAISKATGTTTWNIAKGTAGTTWEKTILVTGIPTITATPTSLTFSNVPVNTTSSPQTVNITGSYLTGNITLTKSGTGATAFNITPTSFTTTGGNCSVTFSPQNAGNYSATLSISSAGATTKTVTLTGTAIVPVVPVTSITGIPASIYEKTPLTLSGTVHPVNATFQTIVWSVKNAGTTGATITGGNTLNTSAIGTVVITATITNGVANGTNYTEDFTINVYPIIVTNITNLPTTTQAGTPLTLSGTVTPSNATFQDITWEIIDAGTTGATISGSILYTTNPGLVTISATIENGLGIGSHFVKQCSILVTHPIIQVEDIKNIPNAAKIGVRTFLTGVVVPRNATNQYIEWNIKEEATTASATITDTRGYVTLLVTSQGTLVITATIADGLGNDIPYSKDFDIKVIDEHCDCK